MFDAQKRKRATSPSLLSLPREAAPFVPAGRQTPASSRFGALAAQQPRSPLHAAPALDASAAHNAEARARFPDLGTDNGPVGSIRNLWAKLSAGAPAPVLPSALTSPTPETLPPAPVRATAEPPAPAVSYGSEETFWRPLIDPFAVIGAVMRAKWLILGTAIAGGVLGALVALSTPKQYLAATELLIDPRDLKLTDRDLLEGGLPSDATLAIVENQVRVLTSGTVLGKVVAKLDLAADPEFNGTRSEFGVKTVLNRLRGLIGGDAAGGEDDTGRRWSLAIQNLGAKLNVERGGKTFVVHVGATTEDPQKSALIANTMTEVFLQTYGDIQSDTAGRAADELNGRLAELRKGVETAERAVEAFKSENGIVDAQGKLITDEEILKLNDQLGAARARALELNARAASARGLDVDDALGGALPEWVNSNTVSELRAQYAALKSQADLLAVRLGPRHPQFLAVQAQLAGARDQLRDELRRIASSIGVDQKRAAALEGELASRLAQLKIRQGDLSGQLVSLRELEREATTKRSVYEAFLLRARETGEQRGINTANVSVISTAFPPLEPVGPSRAMIAITGALAGLGLGVVAAGGFGAAASLRANALARRPRAIPARLPQPAAPTALPPEPDAEVAELRSSLRDLHARIRDLQRERFGA